MSTAKTLWHISDITNVGSFFIIWSLEVFETNESTAEDIFNGHQVLALLTAHNVPR